MSDTASTPNSSEADPPKIDDTVAHYFAAWNAPAAERAGIVSRAFTPDAYYCDGAAEAVGHTQIVDMMAGVMEQFEGARFRLASPIDMHHRQARFAWTMEAADGATIIDGIDAVRIDETGAFSLVLGFFGGAFES